MMSAASVKSMSDATVNIMMKGNKACTLLDTGSSESFISQALASSCDLPVTSRTTSVSMASTALPTNTVGYCVATFTLQGCVYQDVKLSVLLDLCMDMILGQDFMRQHESLTVQFRGHKPALSVCGLATLSAEPAPLFVNLTPDCTPVATKSRMYSAPDRHFIEKEVSRLLKEGIIEPSTSPWRHGACW